MVRRTASLAQQIILEILTEIESGVIGRDDGLLPSEAELSRRFGVSRATVREALAKLEISGTIIRRQGVGTFVNCRNRHQQAGIRGWFNDATALIDFVRNADADAQARIIGGYVAPVGDTITSASTGAMRGIAEHLEIEPTSQVVTVHKIFLLRGVPVIHCVNTIPLKLMDAEATERACELFTAAESPYQFLDRWCHLRVHHQQSEIRAVTANEELAHHLMCEPGAPLLRVEEVGYSMEQAPIFYGLNHFRGDLITFRQIRHPAPDSEPLAAIPAGDRGHS